MKPVVGQSAKTTVGAKCDGATLMSLLVPQDHADGQGLPAWLRERRAEWRSLAAMVTLPTARDEEWRFTSLTPLLARRFVVARSEERIEHSSLTSLVSGQGDGARLVFVNGVFESRLSTPDLDEPGVEAVVLSRTRGAPPAWVAAHFRREVNRHTDVCAILNNACFRDAVCIRVAPGAVLRRPVHLIFVTHLHSELLAVHPHVFVSLGTSATASICEHHLGVGAGAYLTNPFTRLEIGDGARLEYIRVQNELLDGFHLGSCSLHQMRDSCVTARLLSLGGALVRQELEGSLEGPDAVCTLGGLSIGERHQHLDTHLRIVHRAPRTTSREVFKAVLSGQSRGVFSGRIIVQPAAQKTDAKQSNMNLLLSDDSRSYSRPQLEIYADDVKCTHGATAGRLNEEALFYLRSRGLPLAAARSLLVHAFAADILSEIGCAALRRRLEAALRAKLTSGLGVGELP